jgi:hypothetical protein
MTLCRTQPMPGLCTHRDGGGQHMYIGGILGTIVLVVLILFVLGRI